jgi:hypothetical protein
MPQISTQEFERLRLLRMKFLSTLRGGDCM